MNLTKPQKLIYDMEKFSGGAIAVICGSMLINGKVNLPKVKQAVNEIYRLNDALRIHINETDGNISQYITEYEEQEIKTLCFENKAELDAYANKYAKTPLDFHGNLYEVNIVTLPEQYGLLIKMHHIIGDAWTVSLLGTQFNKLMNGGKAEAYSYTEYIENESFYLQSKRCQRDRAFFLEQFKKCDEATYLKENQNDSLLSHRRTFVIEKARAELINDYAKNRGSSAFILFTAALSAYINRIKMNAEKFYIGTAVLNRNGVRESNTAGMFVNTVPMLIELDNNKSFAENLSGIENTVISVFRHQKYNYGDLLSAIRKEQNFTEKLYDVVISYQNAKILGEGIFTTWYSSGMQSESLQIHIDDRDDKGIFRIHYDFQTEKFNEHEIERLHQHILNLLFDAIGDDSKKLFELNILAAEERQKLLNDFNNTASDYPKDKCVHQLFEEQVKKTPDNVAVIAFDKTLTYAELNEQANRIANSLIEKGVKPGDIVAVILPRNSKLIPTLFGVLKSGAAYMPLDPSYPKDRIEYLIKESGATYVIQENNIDDYLSFENAKNPCIPIEISNLFCALHTSGSTGKPKVTALTQQNLLNFLYSNQDFWERVETVISVTIVTFDVFMQDSLLSLVMGKKVILASNEQIYNQIEFEKMFEKENNIMFFSTPTKLMSYIKQSKTADFLKKITSLIVGGEVFTDELYDLIIEKIGAENLRNGYGPAEATIAVSYTQPDLSKNSGGGYTIFTDRRKQQCGYPKQRSNYPPTKIQRFYNAYGPCETTILVTKLYTHC